MFSTSGLFKNIACPEGDNCTLLNCIFSHELRPSAPSAEATKSAKDEKPVSEAHQAKRRKFQDDSIQVSPPSIHDNEVAKSTPKALLNDEKTLSSSFRPLSAGSKAKPGSLHRAVSPPPLQKVSKVASAPSRAKPPASKEVLNPRMIPNDPAGHAKRTLYLIHMHEQMKGLNTQVATSEHPQKRLLILDEDELIRAALDVEERLARENSKVYANIIKLRIAAYKKMKLDDWITHVKATFDKAQDKPVPAETKQPPPIETGLTSAQEPLLLEYLLSDQANLAKHGYIPTPPTEAEIAEAEATIALSNNYEVCDRCKSRFQVFPDRREEDGALTTNGPCVHHWGRPLRPKKEKTDAIQGAKEQIYSCCGELLNSKGCTECESHAFKVNDPKRLAFILPFITTPENPNPAKGPNGKVPKGVTFDCEMGYTVCGLELIRLTAVAWPSGDALVDVLVRPQGAILDLNSRFSGVWPDAYSSAIPYNGAQPLSIFNKTQSGLANGAGMTEASPTVPLSIVPSPAAARELLCSYLTPKTPLIGHALENDLNSVRLCHPTIIDTIVLYPHPRGLPLRFGLKMLTKKYLERDIQMGGAMGHDSLEDARATGDLVRHMVGKKWAELEMTGWRIEGGELQPPLPPDDDMPTPPPLEGQEDGRVLGAGTGIKRQRIQISGGSKDELESKRYKAA